MTRSFAYPPRAIASEGLQGTLGLAVTVGPLLLAEPAGTVVWFLATAAALFLVYFARAVVRYLTRIELDERGMWTRGPVRVAIPWEQLRSLRLNHYTTRSDGSGGWMQLVLEGGKGSIRIDSSLSEFVILAALASAEASRRGVVLDERSRGNLRALGVATHD